MMMLTKFPRVADLHDSRGLPVSEMDGSTGIVDSRAMQRKPGAASAGVGQKLTSADGAPFGEHWTFSVSTDAQKTCERGARSTSKLILSWVPGSKLRK